MVDFDLLDTLHLRFIEAAYSPHIDLIGVALVYMCHVGVTGSSMIECQAAYNVRMVHAVCKL